MIKATSFKAITRVLSAPYLKTCVRYQNNIYRLLKNRPQTQFTVLDNCLTIATQDSSSHNICIGAYIDAGSRYENNFERGITHFFEHVAFSGTEKLSKDKIHEILSNNGATFKCFTTREMAVYYIECLCENLQPMLNLMSEVLFHNKFNDIEFQKNIVYTEMLDDDKNPETVLMDYLHQSAYQGTGLADNISGKPDNLHRFDQATMTRYLSKKFVPDRMVLSIVGGIDHGKVMNIIHGSKFASAAPVKCRQVPGKRYTGSQILFRDDSMPEAHIAVAYEAPSFCHADKLTIDVIANYIGAWDKNQYSGVNHVSYLSVATGSDDLCSAFKAFNITYRDTGLFGLWFLARSIHLENVIQLFQADMMHLCYTVSDEELVQAKNNLISSLLFMNMHNVSLCHKIGYTISNCVCDVPLFEQICTIQAIDAKEVRRVASEYFYDKCPVVVGVGPTEGVPDYNRLRASSYWLRV